MITPTESEDGFIGSNQTTIIIRGQDPGGDASDAEQRPEEEADAWGGRLDAKSLEPKTAKTIAAWINTAIANQADHDAPRVDAGERRGP